MSVEVRQADETGYNDGRIMSDFPHPTTANTDSAQDEPVDDRRLYLPSFEGWSAHLKTESEKVYCYSKKPGEDFYHRISRGEIYVQRDHEKYCIECALRLNFLTNDRLFWQKRK